MKKTIIEKITLLLTLFVSIAGHSGCGDGNNPLKSMIAVPLKIEEAGEAETPGNDNQPSGENSGNGFQDIDPGTGPLHPIFNGKPGVPYHAASIGIIDQDSSGLTVVDDYDGDGIPNHEEDISNPFVADYPRIEATVVGPIVMELQVEDTIHYESHTEMIEQDDMKETISNSMEQRHYSQINMKTTPYVFKQSSDDEGSFSSEYGYQDSSEITTNGSVGMYIAKSGGEASFGFGMKQSHSENFGMSESFRRSRMSEKTVFEDVNYLDNLNRNGMEFKDETVQNIVRNYRNSDVVKASGVLGPYAGFVKASFYLTNNSVNMPVVVSNVKCKLSFRTPGGRLIPMKDFYLRNDDYSDFVETIYGGESKLYTIEVNSLRTQDVKNALNSGCMPHIDIISYDMINPADSPYQPPVQDLRMIEETAKSRTAVVKIYAANRRDLYRVTAFDVDENSNVTPGISLKKALFNVFHERIGNGERWEIDRNGYGLTVADNGLKWKSTYEADPENPNAGYIYSDNVSGNAWKNFETYVKRYTDEYNRVHRIEAIKRIGTYEKKVPFENTERLLTYNEVQDTRYWVIFHNGRYFEGDLNDPIWAGDRYEIILFDVEDFNERISSFDYTPLQAFNYIDLDTRWNSEVNREEFDRAIHLGRIFKGDIVQLEVKLKESRFLFNNTIDGVGVGAPHAIVHDGYTAARGNAWFDFHYSIEPEKQQPSGIPGEFDHYADGGANSIFVTINESENAREYEIRFRDRNEADAIWREVVVTADYLKQQNGRIAINSRTLDRYGNEIGIIRASDYDVEVNAHGASYDVPVSTSSLSNRDPQGPVTVKDAIHNTLPGSFSFSATGNGESIMVMISPAENTEYYQIRCYGPMNYGNYGENHYIEKVGFPGLNRVEIPHPFDGLEEAVEPGVYRIEVTAVNRFSSSDPETYSINNTYPSYQHQRIIQPKISHALYDLSAVDLEVNFDDGTGWYRLKLAGDDHGNSGKEIECRFSSYIDYRNQKFTVTFMPPSGENPDRPNDDVFRGGKEVCDLYIRTVAEPRYRDTFWMKKSYPGHQFQPGGDCIVTDFTGIKNFVQYWLNRPETDASRFEKTIDEWGIEKTESFSEGFGNIGLIDQDTFSYFFSPLEQRKYKVRAQIVEDMYETPERELFMPRFQASVGPECINLVNIQGLFAEWYEIWWKHMPGEEELTVSDAELDAIRDGQAMLAGSFGWNVKEINVSDNGTCEFTIEDNDADLVDILPDERYIVAVVGRSSTNGRSRPRFFGDINSTLDNLMSLIPYPFEAPQGTPNIEVYPLPGGLDIAGISVPGAHRYIVEWRISPEEGEEPEPWQRFDTGRVFSDWSGTHVIENLVPREYYDVRAYAMTMNGLPGEIASLFDAMTMESTEASVSSRWDVDAEYLSGGFIGFGWLTFSRNAVLSLVVNSLPENTVSYDIEYWGTCNENSKQLVNWNSLQRHIPRGRKTGLPVTTTKIPVHNLAPVTSKICAPLCGCYFNHGDFEINVVLTAYDDMGDAIEKTMTVTPNNPFSY